MPEPTYSRRPQLAAAVRDLPRFSGNEPGLPRVAVTVADVVQTFDEVHERLDALDAQLARLVDAADPNGTDPAAWPLCQLPPVVAAIVAAYAEAHADATTNPEDLAAVVKNAPDLFDEPTRSDYGARIEAAAAAALRVGPIPDAGPGPVRLAELDQDETDDAETVTYTGPALDPAALDPDRARSLAHAIIAQSYHRTPEQHPAGTALTIAADRIAAWLGGAELDAGPHPWPEPTGPEQTAARDEMAAALAAMLADAPGNARTVADALAVDLATLAGVLT